MQFDIRFSLIGIAVLAMPLACDSGDDDDSNDRRFAYEPEERIDFDNVVFWEEDGEKTGAYNIVGERQYFSLPYKGGQPQIEMDDPPKSGFRIALPRIELEAGQEVEFCQAWPVPAGVDHRFVYASALHTGPGLHHANMFAVPIAEEGPNPYPNCRTPDEAMGASFGGFFDAALRNDISSFEFPQVLVVNSTQTIGSEYFFQSEGYAFEIPEGYEIVIDVHLQNASDQPIVMETAWDFYTMPEEEVQRETQAMTYFYLDLDLPAQQRKTITTQCEFFGDDTAQLTSIMPHTHQWAEGFTVRLLDEDKNEISVPYDRMDMQTNDSWIESFDPPVELAGVKYIEFSCHFNNDLDHDMGFGVGENEMCFFFGYVTPPEALSAGIIFSEDVPCVSLPFGQPDVLEEVDLFALILDIMPLEDLMEIFDR